MNFRLNLASERSRRCGGVANPLRSRELRNFEARRGLLLKQEFSMKHIAIAAAFLLIPMSSSVFAKGCIKGAIVGGVAVWS